MNGKAGRQTRIEALFSRCRAEDRAALICFLMAGDPSIAFAQNLLEALPEAGADIIEIGMPFSDPMADGPAIQKSALRAIAQKTGIADVLAMVKKFRLENDETPLLLMGYYNPVYNYGRERFLRECSEAGVDGLIIVDLPMEEDEELKTPALQYGLDVIRLISPVTPPDRLAEITKDASGFIYYITITGVTGTKSAGGDMVEGALEKCKACSSLPVVMGFGIKEPEQAALFARKADGVVVGTAIVEKADSSGTGSSGTGSSGTGSSDQDSVRPVTDFVASLARAVRLARK